MKVLLPVLAVALAWVPITAQQPAAECKAAPEIVWEAAIRGVSG